MLSLDTAVVRYLHDVLGLEAHLKTWGRTDEVPYFLRDAFRFSELALLGQTVVLAMRCAETKQSLTDIRSWLDRIKAFAGQPVIYVTDALASYDRRRLIEQKVSFIVPGNQLYLPDLGLDLREYFRQRPSATEAALSPSAQAMLIACLLRPQWQSDWQPSAAAAALGYTPMTLSRAVKELTAAGLAGAYMVGRSRWLRFELPPEQVWERAKPALRTPVRRTVWVASHEAVEHLFSRIAGLSALAHYSMLTEPKWPIYAMTTADWKVAAAAGVEILPEPAVGAYECQLWSYSPALLPSAITVDPLSLTLSLEGSADDRIEIALDELKGQLPW